jgi:hypothetical protein
MLGMGSRKNGLRTKYIYIKSTTVYVPSSELGLSPNPSLASECAPPPRNRGRGAHSPAVKGLGDDWKKA